MVITDECTNVLHKEQLSVCIRWVDETFTNHEDVIGLRHLETIDANCRVGAIKNVQL